MEELPQIIADLAYILVVASCVTIVFKRLKQPLVLGYIVAGFLAGPNMPYTPSVTEMGSIDEWSEIGVIFLMFSLGLEFSFKRIVRMGVRPIVCALSVMLCMMGVGSGVAMLFGWGSMDRLFLGGMLAMSSTTIIYKAFDDLGLRSRPFANGVLSVLILEDIFGILLMVVLSAMAVSRQLHGMELLDSLLQLGFFLLLWFLVGVYLVPLLLRKYRRYINAETLLIVSVGLCFLLVVLASKAGYSPAFGAFMMGSILAETVEAERIEHTVSSLRDLFGAIFFVSVGMLVDPSVLFQYWLPILAITCAVVVGQMVFGSMSFLISGSSLRDSVQSGFSLVQIGEFAFIIAALGLSLGVTSSFLYPVVVAVSIITTFLTPYIIRMAEPACKRLESILPGTMAVRLTDRKQKQRKNKVPGRMGISVAWSNLIRIVFMQSISYITICVAVIIFSFNVMLPILCQLLPDWLGNMVCGMATLAMVSPCIRPIIMRKNHSREAVFVRSYNSVNNTLYWVFVIGKLFVGIGIIYYVVEYLSALWWVWNVLMALALAVFIIQNRFIKLISIRIERTYHQNLTVRERQQTLNYGRRLRGGDLQIFSVVVPHSSRWGGRTLSQLRFGSTDHIHVAAIVRGSQRINIPGGQNRIYPGDTVEIVSDEAGSRAFRSRLESDVWLPGERKESKDRLSLVSLVITEKSPLCGKTLVEVDFRSRYHCMVVGTEDSEGNLQVTQAQRSFQAGDTIWVVGEDADLSLLRMGV